MNELTTKEAAEKLGISIRQVQTLIKQGTLEATKKGRDWFVLEKDVDGLPERKKTGRPKKTKDAPETVKPDAPEKSESKTLLSIESAAVKMKCKESKISAMIRDGRLPSVKVGGRRMVDEKDLK